MGMKLGIGLYRHMLKPEYYQFARQCGCTHLIIHLANYYTSDTNVVTATDDKINYGYSQAGDPIWELDSLLNGATALAICHDDPVAPARVVNDFAKKIDGRFEIKGGFMDGKVIPLNEVLALAAIPPLPTLRAQVLGTMLAPISSLAIVLKAIADEKGGYVEREAPAAE